MPPTDPPAESLLSHAFPPDALLPDALRAEVHRAVGEALRENREWLRELVQEALSDAARAEAHREAELRAALADPRVGFPAALGDA